MAIRARSTAKPTERALPDLSADSRWSRQAAAAAVPDGQVKSAGRVLDIFEYFAGRRAPATIQDVVVALAIPHSSASALLNSLRQRGYLDVDERRRTFVPGMKLLQLTDWLGEEAKSLKHLHRVMDDLQAVTGETVLVASMDGAHARYERVLPSTEALQMVLHAGVRRPLHRTASGVVLLTTLDPAEQAAAIERSVALVASPEGQVVETLALVEAAKSCRWSESQGRMSPGLSVVAVVFGRFPGLGAVSVGVGGPAERIAARREHILAALERATGTPLRRSGPVAANGNAHQAARTR